MTGGASLAPGTDGLPEAHASKVPTAQRATLRSRLLRHVLAPLVLTWALGSVLVVGISSYFTQQAYDRSMLDDALLLAAHVELHNGALALDITNGDLRTLLYDQREKVYFAVLDSAGGLVAGHSGLNPASAPEAGDVQYLFAHYAGREVRVVVLQRTGPLPHRVVVALTTAGRREMLRQLLVNSLAPQVLLLLALAVWLRRQVNADLAPLAHLREAVEQRDAADLSPLPGELLAGAGTRDVHGLALSIDALLRRVADGVSAQREFAGNVAHELKTPLAGVRAAAEYGLAQTDPARWREQLLTVLQGQQRASHLIDQLLALALANEADGGIRLLPLRADTVVREMLVHYLPHVDQAGFELEASGLDEPLTVLADRALFEGLLGNLLDNALRHGRSPGGGGQLRVDLAHTGRDVCLTVTDQGPGLPAQDREALLQRWARGPSGTRLGEGAGLGLSIVARYAQLMGAALTLGNGPGGQGLDVTVRFSRPSDTDAGPV